MITKVRLLVLGVVVALVVGGTVGYVVVQRSATLRPVPSPVAGPPPAIATIDELVSQSHITFRNTEPGDGYGMLAMAPLADPSQARATSTLACDRLHSTHEKSVCLVGGAPLQNSHAEILTAHLEQAGGFTPIGSPSRARVSPDGRNIATTTFRSGDSYATPGAFSTQTLITSTDSGASTDLEQWPLYQGEESITAIDRNFWGVTFGSDGDTFFATAAWGGRTWLVQGSIRASRLDTVREDAECPSLSPNNRRLVYKKLGDRGPGAWRLTMLDLGTGEETQLAETRTVDDQVEWLDDDHVLYTVPRSGPTESSVADIFVVPADGTGSPALFIPGATSPAVVR